MKSGREKTKKETDINIRMGKGIRVKEADRDKEKDKKVLRYGEEARKREGIELGPAGWAQSSF